MNTTIGNTNPNQARTRYSLAIAVALGYNSCQTVNVIFHLRGQTISCTIGNSPSMANSY